MKVKIDSLAGRDWQLILNPVIAIDSWRPRKWSITFAWLFWTLSFEWERKK